MEAQDQNPWEQPQIQAGVPPESSTCRGTVLTFLLDGEVVCQVFHRQLPIRNAAIPLWTSISSYRYTHTQAPNLQELGLCSGERLFTCQDHRESPDLSGSVAHPTTTDPTFPHPLLCTLPLVQLGRLLVLVDA